MEVDCLTFKVVVDPNGGKVLMKYIPESTKGVAVTSVTDDDAIFYKKISKLLGDEGRLGNQFVFVDPTNKFSGF